MIPVITHWSCHAKSELGLSLAISPANLCSEFNFLMSVRQLNGGLDRVEQALRRLEEGLRHVLLPQRGWSSPTCRGYNTLPTRVTPHAKSHNWCHKP